MVKYYTVDGKSCCLNGQIIKDCIEVAEDKAEAFEAAVRMGLLSKEPAKKEKAKAEEKKEEVTATETPAEKPAKQNRQAKRNKSNKK